MFHTLFDEVNDRQRVTECITLSCTFQRLSYAVIMLALLQRRVAIVTASDIILVMSPILLSVGKLGITVLGNPITPPLII